MFRVFVSNRCVSDSRCTFIITKQLHTIWKLYSKFANQLTRPQRKLCGSNKSQEFSLKYSV